MFLILMDSCQNLEHMPSKGALGALERTYKVELEETSVNNTFVVLLEDSSNQ